MDSQLVTIKLEDNHEFEDFSCRGRDKNLCDGCRLRFLCMSERNIIIIPVEVVVKNKIKDMKSLVDYMFGEGKVSYEIKEYSR